MAYVKGKHKHRHLCTDKKVRFVRLIGRILNVTSVKGRVGTPQTAVYTMTKYAGEGFADVLRIEMRQWGVKVILIEPGNFGGATSILKNANVCLFVYSFS